MGVAKSERRIGCDPVEDAHKAPAFLQFGLHARPFCRLLANARQKPRAAGVRQAGRAHELVASARGRRFLIGVDQTEHRRGRTGKAQLVGEEIANQPCTFVGGPARRIGAHRKVPEIKAVGIDFSDHRRAVRHLAGRAEALGCEQQAVFAHHQLDIAADSLRGDRILGVVGYHIVLRRGRRRGEVVDQRDQTVRLQFGNSEAKRFQHGDQAFADLNEFLGGDRLVFGHADRDEDLMMARMEGGFVRS